MFIYTITKTIKIITFGCLYNFNLAHVALFFVCISNFLSAQLWDICRWLKSSAFWQLFFKYQNFFPVVLGHNYSTNAKRNTTGIG